MMLVVFLYGTTCSRGLGYMPQAVERPDGWLTIVAKRRVGDDMPPLFQGQQLPQSEIMQRLAANSTWHTKGVEDTKLASTVWPRRGFTVRMMRHSDGAVAHLHFVHVIDDLYRLVRWDADDALYRARRR
jgi:hypothetical protein